MVRRRLANRRHNAKLLTPGALTLTAVHMAACLPPKPHHTLTTANPNSRSLISGGATSCQICLTILSVREWKIRQSWAWFLGLGILLTILGVACVAFDETTTFATMLPQWGWAVFSGLLSIVLGIVLLVQMPAPSVWFIGFAIGVDLIFDGAAITTFAVAIHRGLRDRPALRAA